LAFYCVAKAQAVDWTFIRYGILVLNIFLWEIFSFVHIGVMGEIRQGILFFCKKHEYPSSFSEELLPSTNVFLFPIVFVAF